MKSQSANLLRSVVFCVGLTFALIAIYGQTANFDFINLDDDAYVYNNLAIRKGFTSENVYLAFVSTQNGLWHPITTLTHLIDVEIYGLKAGGHHLTNVFVHVAASILLFYALNRLTQAFYPSAFATGLFALHPLRVESVAWVAERKDVLTGFFFAAVLLVYFSYARHPSFRKYCRLVAVFILGVMCKPSFVTVPFIFLLLDYWPLGRDKIATSTTQRNDLWRRLFAEKLPLIVVSLFACLLTILTQSREAIVSFDQLSVAARILNAGRSYVVYLIQFIWPTELIPYYPFQRGVVATWQGIAAWCVVLAISCIVFYFSQTRRYLVVGWLWYLVMLLPMIGLLQAGTQGHADRFTYLPQIGIAIAIAFGLAEWLKQSKVPWTLLWVGALVLLATLSFAAHRQASHWRNGVTLFSHAIDTDAPSEVTYNLLGVALHLQGRVSEATAMYERAIELNPQFSFAVSNLGNTLSMLGKPELARPILERAIELDPGNSEIVNNLAATLNELGCFDEAVDRLESLLERFPMLASARVNLGLAKLRQGKMDEAITNYRIAIEIDPNQPVAHSNLAIALARLGKNTDAVVSFREAIRLQPKAVDTLSEAAWIVATDRNASEQYGQEGLDWAKRGVALSDGRNPTSLMKLAASLAANNQFDEALVVADEAEKLASQQGLHDIAEVVRSHLQRYHQKLPLW